jgi:hypothetical protein
MCVHVEVIVPEGNIENKGEIKANAYKKKDKESYYHLFEYVGFGVVTGERVHAENPLTIIPRN